MKKILILAVAMTIIVSLLVLTACRKQNEPYKGEPMFCWECTQRTTMLVGPNLQTSTTTVTICNTTTSGIRDYEKEHTITDGESYWLSTTCKKKD